MSTNYLFPMKVLSLLQNLKQQANYNTLVSTTKEMAIPMPEDSNDRISLAMPAVINTAKQELNEDNIRVRLVVSKNLSAENLMKNPLVEVYLSNNGSFKTVSYKYNELSPQLALAVEVEILYLIAKAYGIKVTTS